MPWAIAVKNITWAFALAVTVAAAPMDNAFATERGFLGMQVQGISGRIAEALNLSRVEGVLVRDVSVDGPASNAGIKRGDLIVTMDGTDIDTFDTLLRIAKQFEAGSDVTLEVLRLGQRLNLKMTLSDWPDGWNVTETALAAQPELGLTFASITDQVRTRLGLRWGTTGVVVTISQDQFAGVTPLRQGDVVVQVNQQSIWHPKQFLEIYDAAKQQNRTSMLVLVERSDGFKYVLQPIVYRSGADAPIFRIPGQGG